jgi:hypothetical protein
VSEQVVPGSLVVAGGLVVSCLSCTKADASLHAQCTWLETRVVVMCNSVSGQR